MSIVRARHLVAVMILGVFMCPPLAAFHFQSADDIYLSGDFLEDVMLAGGTVNFDGSISGDLLSACRTLSFAGTIDGNLNAAAQRITVNGEICRSMRAFAQTVNINSRIDGDVTAFATEVTLSGDAAIGRDIAFFGTEAFVDGTVGSDAYIYANSVIITGRVEGNLKVKATKISIAPGAFIGGDFSYESKEKARISPESQILGETRWKKRTGDDASGIGSIIPPPGNILWSLLFLVGSIIIGVLLILIRRDIVISVSDEIRRNGAVAGALGLAVIFFMPVAIVLTGITMLGLPLALTGLTFYALLFFVGKVFAAITVGIVFMAWIRRDKKISLGWSLILGSVLLALCFKIPIVGWLLYLGAWAVGSGAIVLCVFRRRRVATAEAVALQQ